MVVSVAHLVTHHAAIMSGLVGQLSGSARVAVRKRAISTIGVLVSCCAASLLHELLDRVLLSQLSAAIDPVRIISILIIIKQAFS